MQHLTNIYILMPEIFITAAVTLLLAHGVIYSKKEGQISQQKKITWLSLLVLIGAILMEFEINNINTNELCNGLLGVDALTGTIKLVTMFSSVFILLLSLDYYGKQRLLDYEYPLLILITTLGMLLLVSSKDLITFYLAIEIISLSSYILATIRRNGQFSTEAGIKYFLLGAVSSGILLFGASLIYALSGETSFQGISTFMWFSSGANDSIGAMFILVAILFKLAAAPFHMWAPDVYEGSPTIVTAFFAIVPKIAIFGILIQFIFGPFLGIFSELQPLLLFSAIVSVLIGSIGALNQTKFKRLVAYSAIGHTGFILLGIATGSLDSLQASFLYIIIYIIMSLNLFTFALSTFGVSHNDFGETNFLSQLSGLSRSNPLLAITMSLCLLSIAGIPPLAGFFSKYLVLLSLISNGFIIFSIIAIIASVIASFYYVRIIKIAYFKDSSDFHFKNLSNLFISSSAHDTSNISLISSLILGSTFFFILTFMFFPNPLISFTFDALSSSLF
jgi:NADH-quinone oxidoreductase subunit N